MNEEERWLYFIEYYGFYRQTKSLRLVQLQILTKFCLLLLELNFVHISKLLTVQYICLDYTKLLQGTYFCTLLDS